MGENDKTMEKELFSDKYQQYKIKFHNKLVLESSWFSFKKACIISPKKENLKEIMLKNERNKKFKINGTDVNVQLSRVKSCLIGISAITKKCPVFYFSEHRLSFIEVYQLQRTLKEAHFII